MLAPTPSLAVIAACIASAQGFLPPRGPLSTLHSFPCLNSWMEGDVVEFWAGGQLQVGVYQGNGEVHPLCTQEDGEASNLMFYDEDASSLKLVPEEGNSMSDVVEGMCRIHKVVEKVYLSQRMCDRRLDPHGEHAEDVFFIESELSPEVTNMHEG
ncbi:unnamed protein product [Chrysoparadoxa australica]